MDRLLIDLHFAPNVAWFAYLLSFNEVIFEAHENFQKGSYRNRYHIVGANGIERLSIPIENGREVRTTVQSVQISYQTNWQKQHFTTLESAYKRSPFFEHYEPYLKPFYSKQHAGLFEFNLAFFKLVCKLIGLEKDWQLSTVYETTLAANVFDARSAIHPNEAKSRVLSCYQPPIYHQVFEDKHGFVPNASILDLLFNEGPNSLAVLHQSVFAL